MYSSSLVSVHLPPLAICSQSDKYPLLKVTLRKLVEKINQSGLKTLYTYTGDDTHTPIYYEESIFFNKMLDDIGVRWIRTEVSDQDFNPDVWDAKTSLLYIPGAIASRLDSHIGHKIDSIKRFVSNGGGFLGWCGAAYWACQHVQYRVNATETMEKVRHLALWKGVEKGPLIPYSGNPADNMDFFHDAVKVQWHGSNIIKSYFPEGINIPVLLSGGGSFVPSEDEFPHEVLGTYSEQPKDLSLAVVKTYVGKGTAILLNSYYTYGADYIKDNLNTYTTLLPQHPWEKIASELEGHDLERKVCFADLLLEATVRQKEFTPDSPPSVNSCAFNMTTEIREHTEKMV